VARLAGISVALSSPKPHANSRLYGGGGTDSRKRALSAFERGNQILSPPWDRFESAFGGKVKQETLRRGAISGKASDAVWLRRRKKQRLNRRPVAFTRGASSPKENAPAPKKERNYFPKLGCHKKNFRTRGNEKGTKKNKTPTPRAKLE